MLRAESKMEKIRFFTYKTRFFTYIFRFQDGPYIEVLRNDALLVASKMRCTPMGCVNKPTFLTFFHYTFVSFFRIP